MEGSEKDSCNLINAHDFYLRNDKACSVIVRQICNSQGLLNNKKKTTKLNTIVFLPLSFCCSDQSCNRS